jgi:DNA-binding NtrC family response regulator
MKRSSINILVVDDERIVRESLRDWLSDAGYTVHAAAGGQEALEIMESNDVLILVADLKMPGMDGIELMKKARELQPGICTIIMTAYATISTALQAMREGAYDYIEKPFCPEKMENLMANVMERQKLVIENLHLRRELEKRYRLGDLVGKTSEMQRIFDLIRTIAPSTATVLIQGESGTGKELVARAIHDCSDRKAKSFVAINCASIPQGLLESELFGHEKGAFTGAVARHRGCFEQAHGGTLFLDEIGEMPLSAQVHLLRVLQEKEVRRVGGSDLIKVDVRVICATNRDILRDVDKGTFREDLYYRLNVVNIRIPPLRERRTDIPLLAGQFIGKFTMEYGKKAQGFSPEVMEFLMNFDWPGNVRQLENAVERSVLVSREENIEMADLPAELVKVPASRNADEDLVTLREIESGHIEKILRKVKGNKAEAARILGIERATLYNKMRQYKIGSS